MPGDVRYATVWLSLLRGGSNRESSGSTGGYVLTKRGEIAVRETHHILSRLRLFFKGEIVEQKET